MVLKKKIPLSLVTVITDICSHGKEEEKKKKRKRDCCWFNLAGVSVLVRHSFITVPKH